MDVQITIDVPPEFVRHCETHRLEVAQVLTAFMADLGETKESNGSDERRLAEEWFSRVMWPEPPCFTVKTFLASSGQWSGIVFRDGEEIAGIAGCETRDDVLDEAYEQWPDAECVDPETPSA